MAQARAHGVTARMVQGRRFRRLLDGVHVCVDTPVDLRVWLRAAVQVLPGDAVLTHVTRLHALGVHVGPAWPLRFASTHVHRTRRQELQVTRVRVLPPNEHRVATVEHAWVTACADLDLVDAVTAADWLLHLRRTDRARLEAYARSFHGRGAVAARRAVVLVRDRVESPRETYLRLLLVLAGLPEPQCNVDLGSDRAFVGRADLVFLAYALIVEYDGRDHAQVVTQWNRDLERLDAFEDTRWGYVRVTAHRLKRPRDVVRRVHAKLVARGYDGPAPVSTPRWVALFEHRTAARRAAESPAPTSWA